MQAPVGVSSRIKDLDISFRCYECIPMAIEFPTFIIDFPIKTSMYREYSSIFQPRLTSRGLNKTCFSMGAPRGTADKASEAPAGTRSLGPGCDGLMLFDDIYLG